MNAEAAETSPHGPSPAAAQGEDGPPQSAAPGIAGATLKRKASALPENIVGLRNATVAFAAQHGADADTQADIALASSEALTNAVIHAFVGRAPGTITVIAESTSQALTVRVIDDGRGMAQRLDSPGLGLGLGLMARTTTSFEIRAGANGRGTETCLVFDVQDQSAAVAGLAASNGNGSLIPWSRAARGAARAARRELAAADAERKHIAQDIHDGVQQRLTALRIRLALAADRVQARGDTEASAALEGFGDEVDQAIAELRDLAHGIYPALLTTHGLGAALTAAARHAAQPVTVRARGVRRCTPAVETAVYFSCLAAIDNAAKHAGPVHVAVDLVGTSHGLRFTVHDTGSGFDLTRTPTGSGIANMHDRISAVGGRLTIDSTPTLGTQVQGDIPDPWLHEPENNVVVNANRQFGRAFGRLRAPS